VVATDASDNGTFSFTNAAKAGDQISYNVRGSSGANAAVLSFHDASSAGTASFFTNGSTADLHFGGTLEFDDNAPAESATIVNQAGTRGQPRAQETPPSQMRAPDIIMKTEVRLFSMTARMPVPPPFSK
jgi:hypothetical protein